MVGQVVVGDAAGQYFVELTHLLGVAHENAVLVGAVTVVVALHHPALGAAIGVGVVVVALLNELMGR
ncbi:hypothetical protein SAMN05216482_0064 [Streptomyces sp. PAN_FS17]|nr:hypothetical protein SAMN05216482_0064 [Streptomyces sp. PAN_FS17]